jgi:hypothetical protein
MLTRCRNPIVARALALAAAQPQTPALHILDAAMEGQHGTSPDFECDERAEWGDWLEPPSPFAVLMHSAFGMHLPEPDIDAQSERWQVDVIEKFGDRYRLWRGEASAPRCVKPA